jgi:hypothetical protein
MTNENSSASKGSRTTAAVAAIVLASLTGCVARTEAGDEATFRYGLWIPILVVVLAVLAVLLTWLLRKKLGIGRWAYPLMVVWALLALGAAPTYHNSYTKVSDQGLENRCGLWGQYRVLDVRFEDISSVEVSTFVQGATSRTRKENDSATIQLKNGKVEYLTAAWSVESEALEEFIRRAKQKGIPVRDTRGD